MAEMSVRLVFSFSDLGSPGLKALTTLITDLGPKVTGLSQRFNTLERSIERVGQTAQSTAGKFGPLDTAINKAEASTLNASRANIAYETTMASLAAMMRAAAAVAQTLSTAYTNLGTAAQTAGAHFATAGGQIAGMNTQLGTMQGRVHGITNALQGMAEMWASHKLFQAGEALVKESSDFQMVEARIKALNYPEAVNREALSKSFELSKQLGFISPTQALEARVATITGLGRNPSQLLDPRSNDIVEKVLPSAIKTATILQMRGDTSEFKDIIRNLIGLTEARGQTSDPDAMIRTFDLMQRSTASGGMKVTTKDVETVLRQAKTVSSLLSDEGFVNMLSAADQFKAMGHGGGGSGGQGVSMVGTMINAVAKFAAGGIVNKQSLSLMQTMGLMDENAKITGDTETTNVNVGPKGMKHSDEFLRDPFGAIIKYFAPAMLKFTLDNPGMFYKGKDPNDPEARKAALMEVALMITKGQGGVTMAAALQQGALPATSSRILEVSKLTVQSQGTEEALAELQKTFKFNTTAFKAALESLELTLGQKILPAVTEVVKAIKEFVDWLNKLAEAHPAAATLTVIAGAILAVVLAISGLNKMFGIWSLFIGMVGSAGSVAGTFAGAWAAAGGVVSGVFALISAAIRMAIPLFAVFVAAWDFGTWGASLRVKGVTISDWASDLINNIVGVFERGWIRIRAIFDKMDDKQRDALLKEQRAKQELTSSASSGATATSTAIMGTGGRSTPIKRDIVTQAKEIEAAGAKYWTKPEPKYSETPEERRIREVNEAAAKLGNMKYTPPDPNAKKLFYNPEATAEKQQRRIDAVEEQLALKSLEIQYKATTISISDYYAARKAALIKGQDQVIDDLRAQKAALENVKQGRVDKAAVARVSADIQIEEMKQKAALEDLEVEKNKDLNALKIKGLDIERQIEATAGHRHRAEIMRLNELKDKEVKPYILQRDSKEATPAQKVEAQRFVDVVEKSRAQGTAGIEYDKVYTDLKLQLDNYKQKEEEVNDAVLAGKKTTFEAERQVFEIRRQEGELIDSLILKLRELALASGNEALIKQTGELARLAKKDLETLSPEILRIKGVLESGFDTFFNNLQSGTKSAKQLFFDFFNSIRNGISQIASKGLAQELSKALFGTAGGGDEKTGLGGFLSLLGGGAGTGAAGGLFAKLFTRQPSPGFGPGGYQAADAQGLDQMATDVANASAGVPDTGFFSSLMSMFGGFGSFATGIDMVPGDMFAQIHKGEAVLSPHVAQQYREGNHGRQGSLNVTQQFIIQPDKSTQSQTQLGYDAHMGLQRGLLRNS